MGVVRRQRGRRLALVLVLVRSASGLVDHGEQLLAFPRLESRERSADRFALELTSNPGAFVSAMRRLAAQNLAEDRPSRVVQWLFYSHPPVAERIAAAQAFKP